MKIIIIALATCLILFGCNNTEEKTTDSFLENTNEAKPEMEMNSKESPKSGTNIAKIEFKHGEKMILNTDSLNARIHLTKESISMDLTEGKNKLTLIVRYKEPFSQNPIEGIFQESPVVNDKMALMMGAILEEGSEDNLEDIPTAYEGTLVITKLTEGEVILEVSGKGSRPSAMPAKNSWKPVTVKVLCKNPQITASGEIKKESMYY